MSVFKTTRLDFEAWIRPAIIAAAPKADMSPMLAAVRLRASADAVTALSTDRFRAVRSVLQLGKVKARIGNEFLVDVGDLRAALAVVKAGRPPIDAEVELTFHDNDCLDVALDSRSVRVLASELKVEHGPDIDKVINNFRDADIREARAVINPLYLRDITSGSLPRGFQTHLQVGDVGMGNVPGLYALVTSDSDHVRTEWAVMGKRQKHD